LNDLFLEGNFKGFVNKIAMLEGIIVRHRN
jgi:hypothetical protein